MTHYLHLIGYASGLAGVDERTGDAANIIQQSPYFQSLIEQGVPIQWEEVITPDAADERQVAIKNISEELAKKVSALVRSNKFVSVIGGDHACAMGTWSGVYDAMHEKGEIGLIWIDAHMDSHTPETTETGRIHGMPLATLLGKGYAAFTSILNKGPKLNPKNVCLIGTRSFEQGEADFLKQLNVKIYFMDEVRQRGFIAVLKEAIDIVSEETVGYGVSLDLDGIDPIEAPAVDVPEPGGIPARDISAGLVLLAQDPHLLATEIVEFNPTKDKNRITEKLLISYLGLLASGQKSLTI